MGCSSSSEAKMSSNSSKGSSIFRSARKPLLEDPDLWSGQEHLTVEQVHRMREEFWQSHSQENKWQPLQQTCQALLDGDIEYANNLLRLANYKPKHGSLEVVYDETGSEYNIPPYCFRRPSELAADGTCEGDKSGLLPAKEGLEVCVRLAPYAEDVVLVLHQTDTVIELKRKLQEKYSSKETAAERRRVRDIPSARQRLFFHGRELDNTVRIDAFPNAIVEISQANPGNPKARKKRSVFQVFVVPKPITQSQTSTSTS